MKAILCTRAGTADDLVLADIPPPSAGAGQALVRVHAAALNFFDTLIIAGKYQYKPAFPFSPAAEFAGMVAAVGGEVRGLAPGDRVMGYMGWGAAREFVAVDAAQIVKLPDGLDLDRAAGLTVTYGTTLYALRERAQMQPGETLVVLGAAGGTGLAAVELGKILGARVIACASSDQKLDFARAHGADATVNYARDDLREALRRLTGDRGVDVVYDPVGGRYTEPRRARARLAGPLSGGRFCRRRNPKTAAQPGAAEKLRHPRRVLGRLDQARAGQAARAHGGPGALVRRGQAQRACACGVSVGADRAGAQSHRRPRRHGQDRAAAVRGAVTPRRARAPAHAAPLRDGLR
jgi:NADPH:quinone reductase-like Zn-dependent oxidoreductase